MKSFLVPLCLLLSACEPPPSPHPESGFTLQDVLGNNNSQGFSRALEPREFRFPEDHGGHDGFRNEWWYLTGNLQGDGGRRFGYQLTFFSTALAPESVDSRAAGSAWQSRRIWMAHAALTDVTGNRHLAEERFSRENPGLAGAQLNPLRVWLEDWQLSSGSNDFPWEVDLKAQDFALSLAISSGKMPVLQGIDGLSQKSQEAGNASYYYSMTRLETRGVISIGEQRFAVSGDSWLDREWSTSALADDQSGWDWFSLQFEDGRELMYYQLRDSEGRPHAFSQGNLTDAGALQTRIEPEAVRLEELESWTAGSGVAYTTEWLMEYGAESWRIKAVLPDQLMDVSIEYWEGAVDVFNSASGMKVGQGYLEMVRP